MTKQQFKDFVKTHKKEIIITTGVAIGLGVLTAIGLKNTVFKDTIRMPGFRIDGPLTIKDLGKLGEEYLKHDSELTKDTPVLEVGHMKFG